MARWRGLGGWLDELRYLLFGCAAPAAMFGLLGWYNLSLLHEQVAGHPHSFAVLMTGPFERALYLAFVSIPVVIYVTRPRAQWRAHGLGPRVAAFVGTTVLLAFPAFFRDGPRILTVPRLVHAIAELTLVVFTGFGVYALTYLRHNFSIIPEARELVTGGPYRFVRHPVYVAEILVALGLGLQGDVHFWSGLILAPFVAIQLVRSWYEEQLLRGAFPEYDDYARRTGRLFPRVSSPMPLAQKAHVVHTSPH
jgi:protein-S-isoprenylcysteine O-methyltransferase Ste14